MMILKLKSVATLIIVILDYYAVSGWLNFERGDQDTFENPNCLGPWLREYNCNGLNADCVNSTCKKCKCYRSHMTFLPFNETNGRCVKNNFLLSFPGKFTCKDI